MAPPSPLPLPFRLACRRLGRRLTRHILFVWVQPQCVDWLEWQGNAYRLRRHFVASTSRVGVGQVEHSNRTPLGLHRVARRIGTGWPPGTVLRARTPAGFTWAGVPDAPIAHRILWLDGLDPGFNRGGSLDSFRRYIYIHGVGDELTLGRPASRGCVHLPALGLIELASAIPEGTLVWITTEPRTGRFNAALTACSGAANGGL